MADKLLFFPFHPDLNTIIEYRHCLKNSEIFGFISFKDDNAQIKALNEKAGLQSTDEHSLLSGCDTVVVLDNYRGFIPNKYYMVISAAAGLGKKIIITPAAAAQLDLRSYHGKYTLLENCPGKAPPIQAGENLHEIDVPVIAVLGQGENCGKFECQLLTDNVLSSEYKTSVVSSNPLGAFFGYSTIPSFFYSSESFHEKVLKFNKYIQSIAKKDSPDEIIVGVPEGIMSSSRYQLNHFGEYPLIVSKAVRPDIGFICTYLVNGTGLEDIITRTAGYCQRRLGIPVGAVCVSKTVFSLPQEESEPLIIDNLGDDYVKKYYPHFTNPAIPVIDMTDKSAAVSAILSGIEPLQTNIVSI